MKIFDIEFPPTRPIRKTKPHIWLGKGSGWPMWYCSINHFGTAGLGMGSTPIVAYKHWYNVYHNNDNDWFI